jgi:fructose-1,6-bisphosphatase/inositol monophosphatase family enzyme
MSSNIADIIVKVLKHAGDSIVMPYFNKSDKGVEIKPDGTPVTKADKECEIYITDDLKKHFPKHNIIGEEFEYTQQKSDYTWVVDPLDGTKRFIEGIPTFGVMMGLKEKDNAVSGGVYIPAKGEMYIGHNRKTTLNGETIKCATYKQGEPLVITTTDEHLLFDQVGKDIWQGLLNRGAKKAIGTDCYNYCRLAAGDVHVVFEQGLKEVDVVAILPILEFSGAKVHMRKDLYGAYDIFAAAKGVEIPKEISDNLPCLFGNGRQH